MKASGYSEQLREHARLTAEAEMKVQSLDKLRAVHDDHQKLVNELIPAAEKSLVELKREKEILTDIHEDVRYYFSSFFFLTYRCNQQFVSSLPLDIHPRSTRCGILCTD